MRDAAYLNTAAEGLWPNRTALAVQAAAAAMQTIGPDRDGENPAFGDCLRLLAKITGATSDDIVLTPSTSHGLNMALQGIDWRPGDNVVVPAREFPAVEAAAGNLIPRGVTVRVATFAGVGATPAELLAACDSRTRAIVCSGIAWNTGYRMDLATLGPACAARGILTVIDGVQLVGAEPLALTDWQISALAFHGYKWLMSGFGIGGLFVSAQALGQIRPVFIGSQGLTAPIALPAAELHYKPTAQRYALGGSNTLGAIALRASLTLLDELGVERVSAHNHALADQLAHGVQQKLPAARVLRAKEAINQSAIVVFSLGDAARDKALVQTLEASGIWAAQRSLGVRVSPHIYNSAAEIARLVSAL